MSDTTTVLTWQLVRDHAGRRASGLQSALASDSPGRQSEARARLAILRRAGADDPSDPLVWPITLDGIDPSLLGSVADDGPSRAERAVHAALVVFGIHMQSTRAARHVPGQRLGKSVRQLAGPDPDDAIVKRFHTFATATGWSQRIHHLRGLVSLMRSHDVTLDYGSLAADLYFTQTSDGLRRARLQWGRDFHRVPAAIRPEDNQTEASADHTKES